MSAIELQALAGWALRAAPFGAARPACDPRDGDGCVLLQAPVSLVKGDCAWVDAMAKRSVRFGQCQLDFCFADKRTAKTHAARQEP